MKAKKTERLVRTGSVRRGFTLLELLVVIGIIGVLTALATVAYSTTQRGGRNTRRKQDLVAIQNALEQYYSDNSFKYPLTSCSDAGTYLKSTWPMDPSSTATTPISYSGNTTCNGSVYCLCGEMEGGKGGNSSLTTCATGTWLDNGPYYCVSNLQ
ncbi:TPA: hypothetical protein DIU27_02095 [Candidatus Collierbacteria bacterium]|uniref:Type II secretion system protein G n=1 Tax=Candidatus Collierbacteria bacterium GW2011_GWB2_44_22 TaxID=1618387 RepID=A0A0G1HYH5_9BACT|nr:MAG: hypothetical protein UW31_C0009G0017 [Candidatus Collierbacteria bacterium GW2011_GWA2_44_13]KKT51537.1 MAG: hypothetical protein UW42_C0001G0012 [Candidatus Collierbacteria bacterium GW2011_GWB1_44_197]KKT52010.1 MAG: hypothetical protein UW44_C0005G0052 [Candidatus Collierbacteria bacterium GW2011_GWB2_44_22]KKT62132.1 MAG: hypothetical protein UW56_C0011G0017 [Candidatus Collierbacteria bacterium GW2011_GWD1_44_27]KKT66702.1 MAG: hypothetical protein UW58_C0004G0051 [Candidatus Colli